MEKNQVTTKQKRRLYWLMQLIGWFSLMFIEIFNVTFFIRGEFLWSYLYSFGVFPILGIMSTHFYKFYFIPISTFSKGLGKIWGKAVLDIILISVLIIFLGRLLSIAGPNSILKMTLPELLVSLGPQLMNIARYVIVWIILYYLYHILHRNNEVLEEKLQTEIKAKSAELELLKTQLNPSFLFQSLSSINLLVSTDKEAARNNILKLSELLRYSLNYDKNTLISVKEELSELNKYVDLEKTRFGNSLSTVINIDEGILNWEIPTALLLNLMEHAIRNGIQDLNYGGKVSFSGNSEGEIIQFNIAYDCNINHKDQVHEGIENLRLRLRKIYGENAQLRGISEEPQQMTYTLTLPKKK